ncbi:hypothetical protein TRVA0_036S00628 [Trichomonascus vanleenenianus]|uniref:uncharacterized protein n=1 Tax=Trichomonascus vanleenenianus TaxID=2268995 RepID=UPI003EC99B62
MVSNIWRALLVVGLLGSEAAARYHVLPKESLVVPQDGLGKRDLDESINRVKDKPSHNENGEQLFHIQHKFALDSLKTSAIEEAQPFAEHSMDELQPFREHSVEEVQPFGEDPKNGPTLLRTELTLHHEVSIFSRYARAFESLQSRLNDKREFTIILAPSDAAMAVLPAKPWEFPSKIEPSMSEEEKEHLTRRNIHWFLASHMHFGDLVSAATVGTPLEKFELELESGRTILVEPKNDILKLFSSDGDFLATVTSASVVDNGIIWVLDRSLVGP